MDWLLIVLLTLQQLPTPPQPPPPPVIEVEEEVIVTATRTGRLAADQVLRVEVVNREEIEEKLLMTPGDIAMLLNETSGIRLQPTSPALGAASVRVQGLPGRFTAVLTDGLPINGTQVASVGLLQIPPMDLQQVEVIKGAASALYGASAVGGVINLVTRRATPTHDGELLLNATTRSGADGVLWASGPITSTVGYTWLTGAHAQAVEDVDGDGWADLPRHRRFVTRPKVSFSTSAGTLDVTGGTTVERRRGGLVDVPAGRQAVDTTRGDLGVTWRSMVGSGVLVARGAFVRLAHGHQYGLVEYDDRHQAAFAEASVAWVRGDHMFVVGGGLDSQRYRNDQFSRLDYGWTTPSVFVQDDWSVNEWASVSASGRVDVHPEFGALWSPRLSVRVRQGAWDMRASWGRGSYAPTVFVDEVEEVGLHHVARTFITRAETAQTWSLDASREFGPVTVSATGFASSVTSVVDATFMPGTPGLTAPGLDVGNRRDESGAALTVRGVELFARAHHGPFVATSSWVVTKATEPVSFAPLVRDDVPLTPRHTFGFVGAWEDHGNARVGVEVYYTGRQRLEDNPYREQSAPYTIIGLLAERRFGRVRAFVNLENLTDVRQSDYDPLLLPEPTLLGKRAVHAWAPLDGRTINAGVRITF
jgi:outer membrane receptor for ferrienterochelin and colicins